MLNSTTFNQALDRLNLTDFRDNLSDILSRKLIRDVKPRDILHRLEPWDDTTVKTDLVANEEFLRGFKNIYLIKDTLDKIFVQLCNKIEEVMDSFRGRKNLLTAIDELKIGGTDEKSLGGIMRKLFPEPPKNQ